MNVFGSDMKDISSIFNEYVKDLKLIAALDKYVYVTKNKVFGDIIFSSNENGINMINCQNIHDKYFEKMYSVDVIRDKTVGIESQIGVLESYDDISLYKAIQNFNIAISRLNCITEDILVSDDIQYMNCLNTNDRFYNDILIKKSSDGANKFIMNNNIMYIAQTMLPGTKNTDVDIETYHKTGNDYYTAKFITHKKKYDVYTFMRFLCL